ncbi:MAG TPA: 3-dehydroquinate synthase [Cyclobacteriaceae bacterium]
MPERFEIHSEPDHLLREFFTNRTYSQIVVLTDTNTASACYPALKSALPPHNLVQIQPGEAAKNLETCVTIWQQLTDRQLDRHSLVLVLGGGVLGDMGGFCAATYKRGIDCVLMPTTLLAQVDASIGGKLGIDFNHFKNHIGVFQTPVTTLISPAFLKTLPERELRSGFAEIIKHCLISDTQMWDTIRTKSLAEQDWNKLILHSVSFKSRVITEDPKEKGLRKILNFGHSIGHAVESHFLNSDHRLFHGEAIAIGMITELFIALKKGLIQKPELDQISEYVLKIFGKVNLAAEDRAILDNIYQDKKNKGNRILMALTKGIGQAVWDVEVNETEIIESLAYYRSL